MKEDTEEKPHEDRGRDGGRGPQAQRPLEPPKLMRVCPLSCVRLFDTLWTAAHQAPLSLEFSRQAHFRGLSFPTPKDLPNQGIEPTTECFPIRQVR